MVDLAEVRDQMTLFDTLAARAPEARVVDVSHHAFRKFFKVMQESQFVAEARARQVEPIIFYIADRNPDAYEEGRLLRERFEDCALVLVENAFIGKVKEQTRRSAGYRAFEDHDLCMALPLLDPRRHGRGRGIRPVAERHHEPAAVAQRRCALGRPAVRAARRIARLAGAGLSRNPSRDPRDRNRARRLSRMPAEVSTLTPLSSRRTGTFPRPEFHWNRCAADGIMTSIGMELVSRGVFGIASAVLMLIALALSIYSAGLIVMALRGPWGEAGTGLLESIGYVVIAVAVFDVAKYFVEEEVIRGREMRLASEARRSLTKFISTIAIAVFIEALVMVFRQGGQDIALVLYPAAILLHRRPDHPRARGLPAAQRGRRGPGRRQGSGAGQAGQGGGEERQGEEGMSGGAAALMERHGVNRIEFAVAIERPRVMSILKWAVIMLLVSLVAALFGFTDLAAASADVAKVLFYIFLVIFLVLLVLGLTILRR